jgi:hypothetical protein
MLCRNVFWQVKTWFWLIKSGFESRMIFIIGIVFQALDSWVYFCLELKLRYVFKNDID